MRDEYKKKSREYDVALDGIEGVKKKLLSPQVEQRLAAVKDALNYKDEGLKLVIEALQDRSGKVQRCAYLLLKNRIEPQVQEVLKEYKFWNLGERLQEKSGYSYITRFANRKIEDFNPQTGIADPLKTAYIVDCHNFKFFLQDPKVTKLQALILRWGGEDMLIDARDRLRSLKALHTGPCNSDYTISWLGATNISPILKAYPKLTLLQVKGYLNVEPLQLKHINLQTLIIESSGLNSENIAQICSLKLPNLKHLELWLGSLGYGGNSSVKDLKPILYYELFPRLTYLGLCNSQYSDDIANEIVKCPKIKFIKILDLSLGTLTDKGANFLLQSLEITQLRFINVSENYLSSKIIEKLKKLPVYIIAKNQKQDNERARFCSVCE